MSKDESDEMVVMCAMWTMAALAAAVYSSRDKESVPGLDAHLAKRAFAVAEAFVLEAERREGGKDVQG